MNNKKNINSPRKKGKLNIVLTIIALICIFLSFFLYLYIIPICLIGIIVCIIFRKKSKIFYFNILLYIICIVLSIILQLFFKEKSFNDLVGTWNCSYYGKDDYSLKIDINSKDKYIWSKYNDSKKNYIIGTYKLEKINKKDDNKNVKYYKLILNGEKYLEKGREQEKKYNDKYEIAINKEEKKAIFINKNNVVLNCSKTNNNNPIIK